MNHPLSLLMFAKQMYSGVELMKLYLSAQKVINHLTLLLCPAEQKSVVTHCLLLSRKDTFNAFVSMNIMGNAALINVSQVHQNNSKKIN